MLKIKNACEQHCMCMLTDFLNDRNPDQRPLLTLSCLGKKAQILFHQPHLSYKSLKQSLKLTPLKDPSNRKGVSIPWWAKQEISWTTFDHMLSLSCIKQVIV